MRAIIACDAGDIARQELLWVNWLRTEKGSLSQQLFERRHSIGVTAVYNRTKQAYL